MHIAFWYQYGKIDNIGTGHKYRAHMVGDILKARGHKVTYIEDNVISSGPDVLVIDHMEPPSDIAKRAKSLGLKVVAIDGIEPLADVSISAFLNDAADYKGPKYIAFPVFPHTSKYNVGKKSRTVFVGMGGFDKNNYADLVLRVLDKMGLLAIVAKSINHENLRDKYSNVEVFEEDNYYDAMHECFMAITNGGLTFFQALHYGMPTVALAQYDHQRDNILAVSGRCLFSEPNAKSLQNCIGEIVESEYLRKSLSVFAQNTVDGKGAERICQVLESLKK